MYSQFDSYLRLSPYLEMLDAIKVALSVNEGIVKLAGATGTGKTALCHELARDMEANGHDVLFFDQAPDSAMDMQNAIRKYFKLGSGANFTRAFTRYLKKKPPNSPKLIIIFDNAEQIDEQTFLEVRMLNSIQNDVECLLRVVLCGSPELDRKIDGLADRSLAQYLSQSFELMSMKREELEEFCSGFMTSSQMDMHELDEASISSIMKRTQGLPGRTIALLNELDSLQVEQKAEAEDVLQPLNPVTLAKLDTQQRHLPAKILIGVAVLASLGYQFFKPEELDPTVETASQAVTAISDTEAPSVFVDVQALAESGAADNAASGVILTETPVNTVALTAAVSELEDESIFYAETGIENDVVETPDGAVPSSEQQAVTTPLQTAVPEIALLETGVAESGIEAPEVADEVELPVRQEPVEAIGDWLNAWENQDVDLYFQHYHAAFRPSYHASLEQWRQSRIANINQPQSIAITFDRFEILEMDETSAIVRFWMNYVSASYEDDTWKEVELVRENDRWLITLERNLQVDVVR